MDNFRTVEKITNLDLKRLIVCILYININNMNRIALTYMHFILKHIYLVGHMIQYYGLSALSTYTGIDNLMQGPGHRVGNSHLVRSYDNNKDQKAKAKDYQTLIPNRNRVI